MPIEVKIWKIEEQPKELRFEPIKSEQKLEELLLRDIGILDPSLFLIGSQVATAHGKFVDILALDDERNLVVIELKRSKTPRDAVAQLLDYGSWAKTLNFSELQLIYAAKNDGAEFREAYAKATDQDPPDELSGQLRLLLVAAELDPESERILNYLSNDFGVPVNAVFFRYFQDNSSEFLTRSWLIDPSAVEETAVKAPSARSQDVWSGSDFCVEFGEDSERVWEEAREYGFISAGGGRRYSRPLEKLFPGARVFVHIPKRGYVGVGEVRGPSQPSRYFTVEKDGKAVPILNADLHGGYLADFADDPVMAEYFVPISWRKTLSTEDAFWKKGLYANQTVVTKLRNQFTLAALKEQFQIAE